jgi:hypothetical protein
MSQELSTYQTSQLAELDKQMAVWNQRLSTLDQQIVTVSQALQDTILTLRTNLNTLVVAADAWIEQHTLSPTSPALAIKVQAMRGKVHALGSADLNDPASVTQVASLSTDLQALSGELVGDLTMQAQTFAEALDKAAQDLVTHYGIQI